MALHADEFVADEALVQRLLAAQHPQWAGLPLRRVDSMGTSNVLFRCGDELVVRLPRVVSYAAEVARTATWLERLAPHLPLPVPMTVAVGEPGQGFPWPWSVHPWLDGVPPTPGALREPVRTAETLGRFLRALRAVDATDAPPAPRAEPLAARDARVRRDLATLAEDIDVGGALRVWEDALDAPPWSDAPVWVHGDMGPGNLLLQGDELSAVIDWGGMGVGDPACDLMVGWSLFDGAARAAFRDACGLDAAAWRRARGHAVAHAAIYIPYYRAEHPSGTAAMFRALARVSADPFIAP